MSDSSMDSKGHLENMSGMKIAHFPKDSAAGHLQIPIPFWIKSDAIHALISTGRFRNHDRTSSHVTSSSVWSPIIERIAGYGRS